MPIILGGLVIALIALALSRSGGDAEASEVKELLPPDLNKASAPELEASANALEEKGLTQTADALRDKAIIVRATEPPINKPKGVPSFKFARPTLAQWAEYVKRSVRGKLGAISPTYALGLYQLGGKALVDAGLAVSATAKAVNGKTVYVPVFDGITQAQFLANPDLQLAAFEQKTLYDERTFGGLAPWLERAKSGGLTLIPPAGAKALPGIEGVPVTASGILGLVYYAGPTAADSWIKNGADRRKFTKTTENFKRFNGIF